MEDTKAKQETKLATQEQDLNISNLETLEKELIALRRDFHEHPELSNNEVRTSRKVHEYLKNLGIEASINENTHGVIARVKGRQGAGKIVALRADMDALPILEKTDLPFKSKNEGVMHACGHDAHTSMLLIAAKMIHSNRDFKGEVRFIFQPAEELAPEGGAKRMIQDGALEGVDAIYGLHVWPGIKKDHVLLKSGPMMAAADFLEVTIKGLASHASEPQKGVDAVYVASNVVNALQGIVSRNVSPLDSLIITIGAINGGIAHNVIADEVLLKGTVRTLKEEIRTLAKERIKAVVEHVCSSYSATGIVDYIDGYPAVKNDEEATNHALKSAQKVFPKENIAFMETPVLGGEDFAYYLQKVKGSFVLLGVGRGDGDAPLHNPLFNLDEAALIKGSLLLRQMAMDHMA